MNMFRFQIAFMIETLGRFVIEITKHTAKNVIFHGMMPSKKHGFDVPELLINENIKFVYKDATFEFTKKKSELNTKVYEYFLSIEAETLDDATRKFEIFLEDANNFSNKDYLVVNIFNLNSFNNLSQLLPKRSFDTIYHYDKDRLMNNIRNFLDKYSTYYDRGIPHIKKYLLSGPRFTGKKSMIKAIATDISSEITIYEYDPMSHFSPLSQINRAIAEMSSRSKILVIENIENIFDSISIEAFFLGLGSFSERSNLLIFLTTSNFDRFREKFDNIWVDEVVNFTQPDKTQIESMFNYYFPNANQNINDFLNLLPLQAMRFNLLEKFFLEHENCDTMNIISIANEYFKKLKLQNKNGSSKLYI